MTQHSHLHVAVGVLVNAQNQVLVALRAADSHQGGLWEFPGGKVEQGESVEQALSRELEEELGIRTLDCTPFLRIKHDYSDKSVLLDVWKIHSFSGIAKGREGQEIQWRNVDALQAKDFPAANERIIRAIRLSEQVAITPQARDFADLKKIIRHLLTVDAAMIYFRQKEIDAATYRKWFHWANQQCRDRSKTLMYCPPNQSLLRDVAIETQALSVSSLHLNSLQLAAVQSRPIAKPFLLSASCHDLQQLQQADALDADFAFLSPVCAPGKYSASPPLGWDKFQQLVTQVNMPVYALGGMEQRDLPTCRAHHGFGIAAISAYI